MARIYSLVAVLLSFFLFPLSTLSTDGVSTDSWEDWNNRPTANTDAGVVVGVTQTVTTSRTKLNSFLGVPFGAQPVRFAGPKRPAPWKTPRDASKTGPACIQQFNYPNPRRASILQWFNTPPPPAGESEDCLSVNVYVPQPVLKPKPVMVWLYGGGLLYGSNAVEKYDGSFLAANNDVIVVVPNYRTNVFGFSGSPQVPATERNAGFLDQRLALDWVQRNIAAFGGDPTKVTIFGESAGAASVDNLLTVPPQPIPFRAAIMESGTSTFRAVPADYSFSWNILVAAMGCGNSSASQTNAPGILACMRALPATKIKDYNEQNRLGWVPIYDNVTSAYYARKNRLDSTPSNSKIARVPILGGSNAHEGRLYSISAANATSFVRGLFPLATDAEITALLAAYPGYSSEFRQLAALYTDFIFQCPARLVALETAQVGIPSYRYYYNASFPNSQIFEDAGVYHASEIGIVLGTYEKAGATPFQISLSTYVQKVWTDFAKDPNGFGKPPWPTVPTAMGEIGGGVRAEDGPNARGKFLTVLNQQQTDVVDSGCAKFQAIYDFLGH